jgi:predicted DNA binding CopG/RHH family protein
MEPSMTKKIESHDEKSWDEWDDGTLGRSAEHAKLSTAIDEEGLNETLGLQSINIRMPKDLLDDLKRIATINGIGYQPLMKQVLQRFVTCEMKQMLRDAADREAARKQIDAELPKTEPSKAPSKKRA